MTEPPDPPRDDAVDEAILARLRTLADTVEPVPEELTLAARSALAYRALDLDLELARLVERAEDKELVGARSDDTLTLLTFEIDDGVIEVEIEADRDTVALRGQCNPPGATSVEAVQMQRDPVAFQVDDLGRFQGEVSRGPVRLVVRWPDQRQVGTEWVIV